MTTVRIELLDTTRCRAVHEATGSVLETDAAPEFGGGGTTFSSTDLLAAALGTCIGSSIAPIAAREAIPLDKVTIEVGKQLERHPNRIVRLRVDIRFALPLTDSQLRKLRNAAHTCVVHRSLADSVDVEIELSVAAAP